MSTDNEGTDVPPPHPEDYRAPESQMGSKMGMQKEAAEVLMNKHQRKKGSAMQRAIHGARMRLQHFLRARFWRGHSVHSPYVFHVVRDVITGRHTEQNAMIRSAVSAYRRGLEHDTTPLFVGTMGAISRKAQRRTVSDIMRRTETSQRYGLLLARLAADWRPSSILELGTSMGVSTAYLATGYPEAEIVTVEGLEPVANIARRHLTEANMTNVNVVCADLDKSLEDVIEQLPCGLVDMAFVDANHCEEATLRYFETIKRHRAERCLIIFDDIFWSKGMTMAWQKIIDDPEVMTTIELPRMGLAYFRTGCQKEHYSVRW